MTDDELNRLREENAMLRDRIVETALGIERAKASTKFRDLVVEQLKQDLKEEREVTVAYLRTRGGICLDLADDIEKGVHLDWAEKREKR